MLALIAGTGDLPGALLARLEDRPLVCALEGFLPSVPPDVTFRIERLGSFLGNLHLRGVREVCMAGAVKRPYFDASKIDEETAPLVPAVLEAMAKGDDGALRALIAIIEGRGFVVRAAHEIAPDLLPPSGVPTETGPDAGMLREAAVGTTRLAAMGRADSGQACLIKGSAVVVEEGPDGTDAMIAGAGAPGRGAILFKGPKPGQDRRADLPVIGPRTAEAAVAAGLRGIIIEAGGVMVLDMPEVLRRLDAAGISLWVREPVS